MGIRPICPFDADDIDLAKTWGYTNGAQVVKFEAGRGQWCARKN